MPSQNIINDPWFIATVSFIATVCAVPLFKFSIDRIRSLNGIFSGQYIGFTIGQTYGQILIEEIMCKNIGKKILGTITGVTVLQFNEDTNQFEEIGENKGKYYFAGFVDERLFVISYNTKTPRVHSAGTIALKGDNSGSIFSGKWAGLVYQSVVDAPYSWVRLSKPISVRKNRDLFIATALKYLKSSYYKEPASQFLEVSPYGKEEIFQIRKDIYPSITWGNKQ
ncbi:MAG: hypothetical protein SCARUB_03591 [Candidatus Scalindua rubra]|uniref:Uncharacterized protein n=1 Tax=Candidatus Scalindua rubra TaxID=1872076 RepID=A0A1E3X6P3_9BACT|nr:MAG: hypothetical protein SCARUB_03591 [Candidatus Scalindua rubra]